MFHKIFENSCILCAFVRLRSYFTFSVCIISSESNFQLLKFLPSNHRLNNVFNFVKSYFNVYILMKRRTRFGTNYSHQELRAQVFKRLKTAVPLSYLRKYLRCQHKMYQTIQKVKAPPLINLPYRNLQQEENERYLDHMLVNIQ